MSRISREIEQCLLGVENGGETLSGRFSFPGSFAGFQGHFENHPVLPGICKVQAVLVLHEKVYGRPFRLAEVTQAKYFMPVFPGQEITVRCDSKTQLDGSISVKASVQKENAKAALLQMVIRHA